MYLVEFNVRHVVPNTALKRRFLSLAAPTPPVMAVTNLTVQYRPLEDDVAAEVAEERDEEEVRTEFPDCSIDAHASTHKNKTEIIV